MSSSMQEWQSYCKVLINFCLYWKSMNAEALLLLGIFAMSVRNVIFAVHQQAKIIQAGLFWLIKWPQLLLQ